MFSQTETPSPTVAKQDYTTPAQSFFRKFLGLFRGDKVIWTVFILLCCVSLIEVYSATGGQVGALFRHGRFLLMGLAIIAVFHYIPYNYFRYLLLAGLLFSFVLLLLMVIFPGIGITHAGATRWIRILGITFQPSEMAKISLMGTVAFLLSKQYVFDEKKMFWWMIGLTVATCAVIVVNDISTTILLFVVIFLMMFVGNVKIKRLLLLVGIFAVLGGMFIGLEHIAPGNPVTGRLATGINRIAGFGDQPELVNPLNIGQAQAARIAIANGGVFGVFPGNGRVREFLSDAETDFIYAIIIEEMGLAGGAFVLLLFLILLIRSGRIARKTEKLFPKYLVIGSALMLSVQALLHIAVNVGAMPVTGLTLPLISLGGTSVVISSVYFGFILSVDRFGEGKKQENVGANLCVRPQKEEGNKPEVEFQEIKVG